MYKYYGLDISIICSQNLWQINEQENYDCIWLYYPTPGPTDQNTHFNILDAGQLHTIVATNFINTVNKLLNISVINWK